MLNHSIWENFFKHPLEQQYPSFEFFSDSEVRRSFSFEPKTSCLRTFETGGAQLIVPGATGPLTFHSALLNPSAFSKLFFKEEPLSFPDVPFRRTDSAGKAWTKNNEIEQACRRIILESGNPTEFRATFEESNRTFLFAKSGNEPQEGNEHFASFTAQLTVQKGDLSRKFSIQRGRTDSDSLMADLEEPLITKEYIERALQQPWPAPRGRVSALWSQSSVAKLLLHFLQEIEFASRNSQSFQALESRFPKLSFQVIDNWKPCKRIDVEGQPRRETLLIDGSAELCPFNEQMPGFSRRISAREFPITAPWEPALFGSERDSDLLSKLGNGIFIRNIEILGFQPHTGMVSFQISEATLVHQGVEGEFIESVTVETPLTELLLSFKLFSDSSRPHPLTWSRPGQKLFVEVSTPEALSPFIDFPGSVPSSHYW